MAAATYAVTRTLFARRGLQQRRRKAIVADRVVVRRIVAVVADADATLRGHSPVIIRVSWVRPWTFVATASWFGPRGCPTAVVIPVPVTPFGTGDIIRIK